MRDRRLARLCRYCRRERALEETFSARGLCRDCSTKAMTEQWDSAVDQVTDSEWRERWRRGMARAVGAVLPEAGEGE